MNTFYLPSGYLVMKKSRGHHISPLLPILHAYMFLTVINVLTRYDAIVMHGSLAETGDSIILYKILRRALIFIFISEFLNKFTGFFLRNTSQRSLLKCLPGVVNHCLVNTSCCTDISHPLWMTLKLT